MRYDLIVAYLQAQGLGTAGVDVFAHRMPAHVKSGILIRGPLDGIKHDHYIPGYFKAPIQVIYRHFDQVTGDTKAKQISAALTLHNCQFSDAGVPAMHVQQMLPNTLPIHYPRLEGEGIEWSLNFDTVYCLL